MRKFIQISAVLIWTVAVLSCMESQARASWFIDAARRHVSVHGQLACTDCHSRGFEASAHPTCADVDKPLANFFQTDHCAGCHGEVMTELAAGSHAGKPIEARRDYRNCIACHDPHYQVISKNHPKEFDSSKPVTQQCGACHKLRTSLPEPPEGDRKCVACHGSIDTSTPVGVRKLAVFCLNCHSNEGKEHRKGCVTAASIAPTNDVGSLQTTSHHNLSCLVCHAKSSEFGHATRERTPCLECHHRHNEKTIHDAHLSVSCEACHLGGVIPVKNTQTGKILWQVDRKSDKVVNVHRMTLKPGKQSCARCHHSGNTVGASALVLPPKSIICMPCHASTFSAGDTVTLISLFVFVLGMAGLCTVWLSGSRSATVHAPMPVETPDVPGKTGRSVLWSKVPNVLASVALDVFLQRRLFKQSKERWFIHALIFFPFLFRFVWGMVALLTSLWIPQSPLPWMLLDKDEPLAAALFDISGLMILVGILLTALRLPSASRTEIAGVPEHDWPALILIGGTVVIGFVLEGMRIAMAGNPIGSAYAFIGYGIGQVVGHSDALTNLYGYAWYLHAIATGAIVAYLPFSRMLHVIMAPVVMAVNATSPRHHEDRSRAHKDRA